MINMQKYGVCSTKLYSVKLLAFLCVSRYCIPWCYLFFDMYHGIVFRDVTYFLICITELYSVNLLIFWYVSRNCIPWTYLFFDRYHGIVFRE